MADPADRNEAALMIAYLLVYRNSENLPEEEIARKLKFESVEKLYDQLKVWGLPEWFMYPEGKSPETEAAAFYSATPERARKPPPPAAPAKKLPPAERAKYLFEALATRIASDARFTAQFEDVLRGKRFETWWQHHPDKKPAAVEASEYPADPLWRLIAMYALADERQIFGSRQMGEPMERLIQALHPEPEKADRAELRRYIEGDQTGRENFPGLKTRAKQIARIVRGGKTKQKGGRVVKEYSSADMAVAYLVAVGRKEGQSDELIHELIGDPDYSLEDIRRLGDIGQELPDEL
jgi:hypothetical protein